uniref:Uncharacterized protein n=1 Tax=Avena sativa TaxID=4498 RepID=A0ACD5WSQ3_AVESA
MNRRFLNLLVNKLRTRRPAFKLCQIDLASLFYPDEGSSAQAMGRESAPTLAGRLPPAAISFAWPCKRHLTGWLDFMAFKDDNIVAVDHEGRTVLYDSAARAIRAMPETTKPSSKTISFTVGDGLYVIALESRIGAPLQTHYFQALIYGRPPGGFEDDWYWRLLQQPCFDFPDNMQDPSNYRPEEAVNPYAISSYALVGDSQVWVSTMAGGTYSYDTARNMWSKASDVSMLPFRGRAEYVPEHRLCFGFSPEDDEQLCAADLSLVRPVGHKVWEDPPLPESSCSLTASLLLPMGSGKLCVARVFEKTDDRGELLLSGYTKANQRFLVLSGLQVLSAHSVDSLQIINHKSKCYDLGNDEVKLL